MHSDAKTFLSELFHVAVQAADPAHVLPKHLPPMPKGKTVVIGAGKASARMAQVLEAHWTGPVTGCIVTQYGAALPCKNIRIMEASHPLPDQAGIEGANALLEMIRDLGPDDLVIALMSGGGSALLPAPPEGFTLDDEIHLNAALLASGMPITGMNAIRKHFSRIKGGRLATLVHPAKLVSLVISDIPGDDPALVSSGPTIASAATRAEALKLIEIWNLDLPKAMLDYMQSPAADAPRSDDPLFADQEVKVIASAALSLEAAAIRSEDKGIPARILSQSIEGEARDVGGVHAAIAREIATANRPFTRPVLLLSGGECTVTLRPDTSGAGYGKGGRNTEFLLALAQGIEGIGRIDALAADTDGLDGSGRDAGAFADEETMERLRASGLDPAAILMRHDSWTAFSALEDLLTTGPTGTNVNDFRAVLIQ